VADRPAITRNFKADRVGRMQANITQEKEGVWQQGIAEKWIDAQT